MNTSIDELLFNCACSLINCSGHEFSSRVERFLETVRQQGLADHAWLYTTGYGPDSPHEAEQVWHTRGAPQLTTHIITIMKNRCVGHEENMVPRLNNLRQQDLRNWDPELCARAGILIASPYGGLVLAWNSEDGDDIAARRQVPTLAQLSAAVVGRWQRERFQRERAGSSSSGQLPVRLPSHITPEVMAAVDITDDNAKDPATDVTSTTLWRAYALFTIIESGVGDLISIHDTKGKRIYINKASEPLLGFTNEELIGLSIYDHLHPEDHSALAESMERMIDHGVGPAVEGRVRDAGGRWLWMEIQGGAVRDDDGRFSEFVLVLRDISARHDFEAVVNFGEHNLSAVLNNVPDAAWLKDAQGRFLFANPSAERLFGAEADELIGRTEGEFVGIADAHRSLEYDQMVLLTGRGTSYTHHLGRDGFNDVILEVHKEPVLNDDGDVIGICGYAQDATRLIRMQLDLIRATMLINHTEEAAPVGLWSIQSANQELYWNRRMFELCGFPPDALQPSLETFLQMLDEESRRGISTCIDQCFEFKQPFRLDITVHGCDGEVRQALFMGAAFNDGLGQVSDIAGVMVAHSAVARP